MTALFIVLIAILVLLGAVKGVSWGNQRRAKKLTGRLERVTQEAVRQHKDVLLRKQQQKVIVDDYGVANVDRWENEKKYFFDNVIAPKLADDRELLDFLRYFPEECLSTLVGAWIEIELAAETLKRASQGIRAPTVPTDPVAFELFCANALEARGWNARVTTPTSDQGADIIADSEGQRVVLQCKLYSSPVGNKAVQEVVAAKAMHGASFGCVVSNQSYTKSAQELAAANGILLLHYDDLSDLGRRLGIRQSGLLVAGEGTPAQDASSTSTLPLRPKSNNSSIESEGTGSPLFQPLFVLAVGLLAPFLIVLLIAARPQSQPKQFLPNNAGGDPSYYYDPTPAGLGRPLTDPAYNVPSPNYPPAIRSSKSYLNDTFPGKFSDYEDYLAWARSQERPTPTEGQTPTDLKDAPPPPISDYGKYLAWARSQVRPIPTNSTNQPEPVSSPTKPTNNPWDRCANIAAQVLDDVAGIRNDRRIERRNSWVIWLKHPSFREINLGCNEPSWKPNLTFVTYSNEIDGEAKRTIDAISRIAFGKKGRAAKEGVSRCMRAALRSSGFVDDRKYGGLYFECAPEEPGMSNGAAITISYAQSE